LKQEKIERKNQREEKMKRSIFIGPVVVLMAITLLVSGSFKPALAKPFYAGKMMILIVPTNPGGGYDFYCRAIAKLMQDELPGSTFVVKNVPGAGSIIGVNEIYRSKPDGLTFGVINPGLIAAQLVGQRGIKFDLKKMSLLGATGESPYGAIAATPKFKSYDDARKADELKVACAGIGTLSYVMPMMAKELKVLDNSKIMLGYRGAQAELAMMQGNIDAQWTSWNSVQAFVKEGNAVPIMFVRSKPKEYQNVPNIEEIVKDVKYKSLVGFMETLAAKLIRGFAGPPAIPADRLKILQDAFKKVTLSPAYENIMKKAGRPGGFVSPDEQREMVLDSFSVPPEHVEIVKAAYGKK